ncbi:MAG: hypothetical protein GXO07_00795 [Crenarchaeota archaeon]|nr:hypothetical protein [Thermoproteota archaeon]
MVIYWRRPVDGEGQIGERCPLLERELFKGPSDRPMIFVSAQFCAVCPYRGKECKEPIWFPNVESRKKDLKLEIYSRLKGGKG